MRAAARATTTPALYSHQEYNRSCRSFPSHAPPSPARRKARPEITLLGVGHALKVIQGAPDEHEAGGIASSMKPSQEVKVLWGALAGATPHIRQGPTRERRSGGSRKVKFQTEHKRSVDEAYQPWVSRLPTAKPENRGWVERTDDGVGTKAWFLTWRDLGSSCKVNSGGSPGGTTTTGRSEPRSRMVA